MKIDVNNRGIYLVKYTGPGQEDKENDPGFLRLPTGCCKFGQSLNIKDVEKRYLNHCNENAVVRLVGHFKDRDDIDAIEKMLHRRFHARRLKNRNNRVSEWMEPIPETELKKVFLEVVEEYYELWK